MGVVENQEGGICPPKQPGRGEMRVASKVDLEAFFLGLNKPHKRKGGGGDPKEKGQQGPINGTRMGRVSIQHQEGGNNKGRDS